MASTKPAGSTTGEHQGETRTGLVRFNALLGIALFESGVEVARTPIRLVPEWQQEGRHPEFLIVLVWIATIVQPLLSWRHTQVKSMA